ncbi:MAG: phosphopantetheine adenylyltransferase [Acidobacteriota bacterium]|jgi:pantetheine-phosphate adenylyltransferase
MRRAIYPGTFDPLTNGHLDIISRACRLFDEVIIGILVNPGKQPLFSLAERMALIEEVVKPVHPQVEVASFSGLLIDFAHQVGAQAVIRGVRSARDYEYEQPMVLMNRRLAPDVETVILIASAENSDLSSTLIKEVFSLGGSIEGLVPDPVIRKMKERK